VTRRFALLVNPVSAGGRALRRLPTVAAELERLGAPHRVVETTSIDHACETARAAVTAGETVAALGGDGFLRPLAGVLRGTDGALAILPGGRGNDFARVLGIPSEPEAAARTAVEGRERLVDVAEVNGTPYIGIASLGFDSEANRIANEARLVRGNLVYLYAALRAVAAWKPARFTIVVDGERHELTGWSIGVCNSRAYGGGMYVAPHAELDDGKLDVVAKAETSKLRFVRDFRNTFNGRFLELPSTRVYEAGERITIDADRPFDVYADGDRLARPPATMRVRRQVLRVIVPPS
jgi:YegS/Rv2252/BmrU family lipid kinase